MTTHNFILTIEADPDTIPHDLSYFVINEMECSMESDDNPGISFVEIDDGTTYTALVTTLEDIQTWITDKGFIDGVHYDEASILAQIKETLP